MQIKALRYLDNEIRKDFETTPQRIGYEQILYLYVRSIYRDIPLGDALKAHKYFIALAQKQCSDFTLYEKALTAVTLNRYGFKQEAQNILKSLRQYAVFLRVRREYARDRIDETMVTPAKTNSKLGKRSFYRRRDLCPAVNRERSTESI